MMNTLMIIMIILSIVSALTAVIIVGWSLLTKSYLHYHEQLIAFEKQNQKKNQNG